MPFFGGFSEKAKRTTTGTRTTDQSNGDAHLDFGLPASGFGAGQSAGQSEASEEWGGGTFFFFGGGESPFESWGGLSFGEIRFHGLIPSFRASGKENTKIFLYLSA